MDDEMNEIEYLRLIVQPLVTCQVEIEKKTDEKGILLTIKLDQEEVGKVIGKQGATAQAIRRLMRQYGAANEKHVSVKIYEPDKDGETVDLRSE